MATLSVASLCGFCVKGWCDSVTFISRVFFIISVFILVVSFLLLVLPSASVHRNNRRCSGKAPQRICHGSPSLISSPLLFPFSPSFQFILFLFLFSFHLFHSSTFYLYFSLHLQTHPTSIHLLLLSILFKLILPQFNFIHH